MQQLHGMQLKTRAKSGDASYRVKTQRWSKSRVNHTRAGSLAQRMKAARKATKRGPSRRKGTRPLFAKGRKTHTLSLPSM